MTEGYSNWNRRDFNAFVRACEKVCAPIGKWGMNATAFWTPTRSSVAVASTSQTEL